MIKDAEDVGEDFAEEARKIHLEEAPPRGIYGEASLAEVKELMDEGIEWIEKVFQLDQEKSIL